MSLYRGFSTVGRSSKFRVTDYDLAVQDLINHLKIAKGEKLMNPEFGSSIWSMLFENITEDFQNQIADEVLRIASYDPRMKLENINVVEYEYGIQLELDVMYIGQVSPTTLVLAFERDTGIVTQL
jgi:phage baseplate assembly protein W